MTGEQRTGSPLVGEWAERDVVELYVREREESLEEEGRIALAEVLCLVLVALFIVVRHLWLT